MLQKILFLSISIISLIAVDNLEPDWRKDQVWSLVKVDDKNDKPEHHYNSHHPVSLGEDNAYALKKFFTECKKIEEANTCYTG